jgi:hypothetical protein
MHSVLRSPGPIQTNGTPGTEETLVNFGQVKHRSKYEQLKSRFN